MFLDDDNTVDFKKEQAVTADKNKVKTRKSRKKSTESKKSKNLEHIDISEETEGIFDKLVDSVKDPIVDSISSGVNNVIGDFVDWLKK